VDRSFGRPDFKVGYDAHVLKCLRIRDAHRQILQASRSLGAERTYWSRSTGWRRFLLDAISGGSVLGLGSEGTRLLNALRMLERECRSARLGVDVLRRLHRALHPEGGGAYRKGDAGVRGSSVIRPPAHRVQPLMERFDQQLGADQEALEREAAPSLDATLRLAAECHVRFVFIHPFEDANGRVARLALNYLLRRHGHGYVVLPAISDHREHFDALEAAHRGKPDRFVELCRAHLRPI
jgi:fido (protein-threonine AMPylation protein)